MSNGTLSPGELAQLRKSAMLVPGQTLDGKFEIIREVGAGAFGVVYEAMDLQMGRRVAVKSITLNPDIPNLVERFEREVEVIKQLEHDNIVRLYDFGRGQRGTMYMAMEFVEGDELAEELEKNGPFSLFRTTKILLQVIDALVEAQKFGIIHRDLKPENIILTQKGARTDVVRLLDFGIATAIDPETTERMKRLTAEGFGGIGTPLYMAPEQIEGQEMGPYTDIYALGLIFCELVLGEPVMDAPTPFAVVARQMNEEVPIPELIAESALGPVVRRAVQKDPHQRFDDAHEMYIAVERALEINSNNPQWHRTIRDSGEGFTQTMLGLGETKRKKNAKKSRKTDPLPEPMMPQPELVLPTPRSPHDDGSDLVSAFGGSSAFGGFDEEHEFDLLDNSLDDTGQLQRQIEPRAPSGEMRGPVRSRRKSTASRELDQPELDRVPLAVSAEQLSPKDSRTRDVMASPKPISSSSGSRMGVVVVVVLLVMGGGVAAFLLLEEEAAQETGGAEAAPKKEAYPEWKRAQLTTRMVESSITWLGSVPRTALLPEELTFTILSIPDKGKIVLSVDGEEKCDAMPCRFSVNRRTSTGEVTIAKKGYKVAKHQLDLGRLPKSKTPLVIKLEK